uniref:Toll-like receptor 2 n=1 Tax=Periophthalmus magnuspinnatus TaxID=409849 RepID=A0A3B3ZU05_9GOBI
NPPGNKGKNMILFIPPRDSLPRSCRCLALDCPCSHSGLSSVPSVPAQTRTLDLDYNQITEIQRQDLGSLWELRVLTIHGKYNTNTHKYTESSWFSPGLVLVWSWFSPGLNHILSFFSFFSFSVCVRCLGSRPLFQSLVRLRVLSFGGDSLEDVRVSDLRGVGRLDPSCLTSLSVPGCRYDSGALAQIWPLDHVTLSLRSPFALNQTLASALLHDVSDPQTHLTLENLNLSSNRSVLPLREAAQRRVRSAPLSAPLCLLLCLCSSVSAPLCLLPSAPLWEKARWTDHMSLDEVFVKDIVLLNNFEFTAFLSLSFLLQFPRKISLINTKVFVMPCPTSVLLKNLEFFDLSENLLTDMTLTETLCAGAGVLKGLRVLNISANAIKSLSLISRMVTRLTKLTHLDISRNSLTFMPQSCPWPQSLRFLNMSRTKFTSATSCLPPTLQVLDLSYNDLERLLVVLPALRELHLSGNKLLTLPPGWLFPNLQTLTVQMNTLNVFTHSDLVSFPRLQNFQAGLNKFSCSCDFVPFFQSLSDGEINITLTDGIHNYFCDSPLHLQGAPLSLVRRSFSECRHVLLVSICCGLVLVFLTCLGVVLWKVHAFWYLEMIFVWLRAKQKRRKRERKRREDGDTEDRPLVTFDAFVSYSERDSAWVDNYLLPELEQTGLCLHRRDFLPGRWIMDNIVIAIESSRRTLFVLSHNFVRSDWCKYELDFTHFQCLEGNCREDAAILVLLEPLHHDDVPKRFCRLRRLLTSTTYLQWPQDPDLRGQFWTSLRQALSPDQDQD